ncbi:MAG: EcsC family protein [Solibacillus sp.]
MESTAELQQHLKEIEAWEQDQKGLWFWEKISRLPFRLLDKVTPRFLQEKLGQIIAELGKYVQTGGQYLVSEKSLIKTAQKKSSAPIESIADIAQLPLSIMQQLTNEVVKSRVQFATMQGASTGFGGLFTLAIDIPAVLGTALKTLQEISILHGYDPKDEKERIFIVKCLQFASSDVVGKEAILNEISAMHTGTVSQKEMISQLKGWQEVFMTYRDHYGWKKLFQMIPVAGIIFGAYANKSMIQDIAEVGTMLYRKRRIYERLN